MGDGCAMAGIGIAHPDLQIAGLTGNVGDPLPIRRPARRVFAAVGTDQEACARSRMGRGKIDTPDGRRSSRWCRKPNATNSRPQEWSVESRGSCLWLALD